VPGCLYDGEVFDDAGDRFADRGRPAGKAAAELLFERC